MINLGWKIVLAFFVYDVVVDVLRRARLKRNYERKLAKQKADVLRIALDEFESWRAIDGDSEIVLGAMAASANIVGSITLGRPVSHDPKTIEPPQPAAKD